MLGTPLSNLQTESLNDKIAVHNFIKSLVKNGFLSESQITNEDIIDFTSRINKIIMETGNILGNAIVLPICSDTSNPNAIMYNNDNTKHVVNFKLIANPQVERPDFISLVFKFPGTFNFHEFMLSNAEINFTCTINNYTDSLTNIDIEFKYHETHQMLKSHKIKLNPGVNNVIIPINGMNIEGLKQISEICFVAWRRYFNEDEGSFVIEDIQVK